MGQRTLIHRHFGTYLGGLLTVCGVTPERLARDTGFSRDLVEQVLGGQQILTGDVALALGDFLGLSPLTLLEEQRRLCTEARASEAERPQPTV